MTNNKELEAYKKELEEKVKKMMPSHTSDIAGGYALALYDVLKIIRDE